MHNKNPFQNKNSGSDVKKVALIYCRVSSKRQAEERFWIETQEAMCKERCERNNVIVAKVIKDWWVSWGTFERDWFDEVLDILDKQRKRTEKALKNKSKTTSGKWSANEAENISEDGTMPFITHFVCVDNSRISRNDNMGETLMMTNMIREAWCEILYTLYPVDYNTSAWMLQENILYAFAAFERRNTRVKAMNGMRARLYDGHRPFGLVPIGYMRQKEWKNSMVVIHPTKGQLVKEALEMYANGILESESAVFRYMKDKGMKSNSTQNTQWVLYKTIVETLFWESRLYFYAGFIHHPKRDINELIPAKHEALISMETVKKIMNRRFADKYIGKTKLKDNPDFPLKDYIHCGHCGTKISWYRSQGRNQKYPYYGCTNKKDKNRWQVARDTIHTQFDQLLGTLDINEDTWNLLEETIRRVWKKRYEFQELMIADKKKALEQIEKQLTSVRQIMVKTENTNLIEDMEKEWELLRIEKEKIKEEIKSKEFMSEQELQECLVQAKAIYLSPKKVRELSNNELRKQMVHVLFGDKLLYDKENGFRTAWNSLYQAVNLLIQSADFLV